MVTSHHSVVFQPSTGAAPAETITANVQVMAPWFSLLPHSSSTLLLPHALLKSLSFSFHTFIILNMIYFWSLIYLFFQSLNHFFHQPKFVFLLDHSKITFFRFPHFLTKWKNSLSRFPPSICLILSFSFSFKILPPFYHWQCLAMHTAAFLLCTLIYVSLCTGYKERRIWLKFLKIYKIFKSNCNLIALKFNKRKIQSCISIWNDVIQVLTLAS